MMQSYYKPKRKQSKRAVFYRRWRQRDDFGAGARGKGLTISCVCHSCRTPPSCHDKGRAADRRLSVAGTPLTLSVVTNGYSP